MSSMRDIKQRIANVSSVEQIIKAMDMVASTKLQKARTQLEGVRPIYYALKRNIEELGCEPEARKHPFFEVRKVKHSMYIILTSNSGLSGSYNANIMAAALAHMDQGKNEKLFVIGSKGSEYLQKKNKNIIRTVVDVADAQVYYGSENLAKWATECYLSGEAEEIFVVYTHFESVLNYVPMVEQLLPIAIGPMKQHYGYEKKYEPDIETFMDHSIPLYLHMSLFRAFSESHTSEQAARMINMDSAGKNASEMIEELSRKFNRKRQANITQELSEIVGSASVLKGRSHDS